MRPITRPTADPASTAPAAARARRRMTAPAAAFVAALALVVAGPAAAHQPETFSEVDSFVEPDPCNPESLMRTTITSDVSVHVHANTTVTKGVGAVTTSNGYTGRQQLQVVSTPNTFTVNLQAIASNPDTDDRYKVSLLIVDGPDGPVTQKFSITCLGGGA